MSFFENAGEAAREIDRDIQEGAFTLGEFLESLAFYIKFNEEEAAS